MRIWMTKYLKYVIIGVVTTLLVIITSFLYQGDHYIEPYTGVIDDMPSDVYVVYPHSKKSELSYKMLKEIEKFDHNDEIDYYLVDYETYSTVLENGWGLQGFPTYYVFARRSGELTASLVYTSFGYRSYEALCKEVKYAVKYGLEEITTDVKQIISDNIKASLSNFVEKDGPIDADENDKIDNYINFTFDFKIENRSGEEFEFDTSKVKILISNDGSSKEYDVVSKITQVPNISSGNGQIVTVEVGVPSFEYNHVVVRYYLSDENYVEWCNNEWYSIEK